MISVRRLRLGEGDLYKRLRVAALSESPEAFGTTLAEANARSEESWQQQADNSARGHDRATLIAIANEEPVGMAALYRDSQDQSLGELIQVWVDPAYRGGDSAKKLITEILIWAKRNNFMQVTAWVVKENQRMLRFLEKCGFELTNEVKSFRDDDESCLLVKEVE